MENTTTLVKAIASSLIAARETLSTAESCSGGVLASSITSQSGASAYFEGGVVAYSYAIKTSFLGVSRSDLLTYGAVCETVAVQMAEGIRRRCGSTYGLATTGIAGPEGGSPDKPVGTVWIAVATPDGTYTECLHLDGSRRDIMGLTVNHVLDRLYKLISEDKSC
ncbi:hypothetical protein HQ45_02850 [Porphyromonas crevioricanis]|uniref:Competence damage-inducible protein A n=2 Tax=Porphyromonas crevioricanis TaxID=393921 RepID=A0A0A2FU39_9PORP|nr:CinA family protein [Porphyromonas crevioricanis]KGN91055.1 hypothetical protein HQ45_02850 [Porphyromonas crevioricanis]KGN94651.1 hypothetical protein HQ38_05575 [Porphyromonas crevioricanis]SJZ57281.1 amidohydrolase, PncC family [Porphyromonas crevioricanis]SQH73408.1 competence damage-inducible protein A [Porphyromonas crevioricanis]GAD06010.1 molybdopterin binding motif, CinA N-terminal domain / C-terminal domain of CinA type S [Porphyromonas crevioricanis JCM 15906]